VTAQGRAALHKEMLRRIEVLESLMAELPNAAIPKEDLTAVTDAIARLKAQPAGPIPVGDYIRARAAKQTLKEIASKTGGDGPGDGAGRRLADEHHARGPPVETRIAMTIKLHRCSNMWVKVDGHPCWRVQKALDASGTEYEVVKGPFRKGSRDQLEQLSGQRQYPVIEFEDGKIYREQSTKMAETIKTGHLMEKDA